ncbi:MAG: hypothetical protein LC737_06110, partial [Chloroflexi bacterium]|nr:hypothetical protein [Chloroflexota bacterium]
LVWVVGDLATNQQLNYVRVNANGEVVFSRPLALPQSRPESPTLFRDENGVLHLFYLAQDQENLQPLERRLYNARIEVDGHMPSGAMSIPGQAVKTYSVAPSQDIFQKAQSVAKPQTVYQIFYSGDDVSPWTNHVCYAADKTFGCDFRYQPQPPSFRNLYDDATRPSARTDSAGQLHLVWFKRQTAVGNAYRAELYYNSYDVNWHQLIEPTKIVSFEHQAGVDLKPPQIAIDQTHVYIAWVQDKRGGRGNLGAQAFYVSFPLGKPKTDDEPILLALPSTARVRYEPYSDLLLSALAPTRGAASNYVNDVQLASATQALGVALLGLQDKQRAPVQVATFVFTGGKLAGFQVVNNSLAPSNQPSMALDAQGHALLAWLDSESGDQYALRYASTDPQLVARWSPLGARDVAAGASNFVWYELSFLPWIILAVPWLFLPLAVLIVKTVIGSDESMASTGTRIALVLAIIVHLTVKLALLPPLPNDWALPLRLVFVAALPALGLVAMAMHLRRQEYPSAIVAYLIFAAVDVFTALFVWMPLANG